MKRWQRAERDLSCGYCRYRHIKIGEPYLLLRLNRVKAEFIRCQDCAGEAPPELPPLIEKTKIPAPMKRLT